MPASDSVSANRPNPDPRTVAGFHLLREVGEGGMSRVFLGYDVEAGRHVAVKLLADHLAASREFVNRFYREARLSRLLAHPNLVRGLGAGYDPDARKHYLVLEFIDGPSAHATLLARGRFPVGVAVKTGIDIARALDFLHARKYIHRDVKPDNVLFHTDGLAKLADLGLAKRLNDDPHLTTVNHGLGTSYYMAYEQALNADLVDGRSDIFALGATLYHLLTGDVPFPGATHDEIMRGKQRAAFVPVAERNPDVPAALAEIIATTLALDPGGRFQTAGELADALAATGLATPIPRMSSDAAPDTSRSDMPTRADLAPLGWAAVPTPEPDPPTASFTATTQSWTPIPAKAPLRSPARRVGMALGLVAGTALAAVAAGMLLPPRAPGDRDNNPSLKRHPRDLPNPDGGEDSPTRTDSR